jgi:hypothetical protein
MARVGVAAMAVAAVAALAGVAAAAHTATTPVPIANASQLPDGDLADVTPLGGAIFVPRGRAQVEAGVHEFTIDLAQPRFGGMVEVHLFLRNPKELPFSLNSPQNHIQVAIWHADPAGTHTLADGTHVSIDPDPRAVGQMTKSQGNVVLLPSIDGTARLHVLARVMSASGRPASQVDLENVQFGIEVRV